jgi:hypothetical protein
MWDLNTIVRINEKAAEQARKGLPERDALSLATEAQEDQEDSKSDEGEIIKLPSPKPRLVACACCVG